MDTRHVKSVRRRILLLLYEHYMADPLEALGPEVFFEEGGFTREELAVGMHYLADRKLVEMMLGYNPPLFAAVRIRPEGIDLVENWFEFNLRFPEAPDDGELRLNELPVLVERLVEEADLSQLGGEARKCLLRDVQYLRDELSRPASKWRKHVIQAIVSWLEEPFGGAKETLPSLPRVKALVAEKLP